jgi:subtilisin family serine protease
MYKIKYVLLIFIASTIVANTNVIEKNGLKYFSDIVVVKFKTLHPVLNESVMKTSVTKKFESYGVSDMTNHFSPKDENQANGLSKIYRLKLTSPFDPIYVASKLSKNTEIEWAEPLYLRKITHTPNDPKLTSQYGLTKVQAEAAWDISKGNSNIIVAIVDSGVDWAHEDLSANIWQNDDPINGVDDDQNGFIDDIRGWDFGGLNGTPDNNPREDSPTHGTHVAGIAAASTNNGVGIAGLGYNLTIMPVKTSRNDLGDDIIAYGYEGIIYAADNGAKIINCSWGGFGYSNAEQEAIDYAVNKGCVLVCAAGNDGISEVIYPAAYNGVLSVGNTNQNDAKSASSNYGKDLDVCAPGSGIYATWQEASSPYISISGTSMASPLVAGLAGLVVDKFPNYTPLQIIEQIRVNADNIDNLNTSYANLLGSGRINAFKALSNTDVKSVRILSSEFLETDNADGVLESGEEIQLNLSFVNYLEPVNNFSAVLSSQSNDVTITQSQFTTTTKGTLEEFNNSNNEFKFTINANAANDKEVLFKLTYSDGTYSDFQLISVLINPTYRTQSGNNISFTITSKGTLAFNDYPGNEQGDGFTYMKGRNLLYEAGLMYGTSENNLISSVRDVNADFQSDDFSPLSFVKINNPGTIADQEGVSSFNDNNAGTKKLDIKTDLKTYSFSSIEDKNYIILKYVFTNLSESHISNFYAGIYFDWDIDDEGYDNNITKYENTDDFGYAYHSDVDKPYIGMALLSEGSTGFYGIANDGLDGGIGVYDGYSDASKWLTLTNGLGKTEAGPNDISSVISAGPYEIKADESIEIAFSISAGIDLASIKRSVVNSRLKYSEVITDVLENNNEIPIEFSLSQNYPNPFNPTTKINFSIKEAGFVKLNIYNMLGEIVTELVSENLEKGFYKYDWNASNYSSGIYFYSINVNGFNQVRKMALVK